MLLFDLIDALERKASATGAASPFPSADGPVLPPSSPPYSTPPLVPWPEEQQPPVFMPPTTGPRRRIGLIDLLMRNGDNQMPGQTYLDGTAGRDLLDFYPQPAELPEYPDRAGTGQEVRAMPGGTKMGGPDISDTVEKSLPLTALMRASLAPDIATQIKRLSEQTGIPERGFGVIDGRIVYGDATGQIHYAIPTFAGADRSQGVVSYLSHILGRGVPYIASGAGPAIPQMAAGVAGGALMELPALSIPAAGAAASATDLGRQWLDKYLAGEPLMTPDYDWNSAGSYGLQGMVAQGLGLGANRVIQRGPVLPSFVGTSVTRAARSSASPYFSRERKGRTLAEYERRAADDADR